MGQVVTIGLDFAKSACKRTTNEVRFRPRVECLLLLRVSDVGPRAWGRAGWWVRAEPQVCSTAIRPMRAPRCFGSLAVVASVSAAALKSRS